jgi:hypothetical protein
LAIGKRVSVERKRGSKGGGRRKIGKHNTRFVMVCRLLKEDKDHRSTSPKGGGGGYGVGEDRDQED